ncbi:MAG: preprotein translocase subunit SecG [Sphingomonadales bacterium]|nr:preprotein translocase subunit SecG [Sphingomonadales bacterium]MBD3772206.1 preprotein translocase subunit SecG [Paracoccaceae bacterium]
MSLFLFLTVVQALVAAALVGVILVQRSEGGGLGIGGGGSPGGLMSARGAADFLTRATRWLAIAFVVLSIALAAVAVETTGGDAITSTLDRKVAPDTADRLTGDTTATPAPSDAASPAAAPAAGDDPLAGATKE